MHKLVEERSRTRLIFRRYACIVSKVILLFFISLLDFVFQLDSIMR